MSKKYKIQETVNDRYVISYMDTPKDKSKLGVWKITDIYLASKPTKFAFRWKVKGKEKTQEQLDKQILENAVKSFNKSGNHFSNRKTENKIA